MSTTTTAKPMTSPRRYPDKLKALQAEFDKEARRNDVYPMTPMPFAGAEDGAGRTRPISSITAGSTGSTMDMVPTLGGRSHRMTAKLDVPAAARSGVIVAEGGRYGGMSLYVKDGKRRLREQHLRRRP